MLNRCEVKSLYLLASVVGVHAGGAAAQTPVKPTPSVVIQSEDASDAYEVEEVVVLGFRGSLADARDLKREADIFSDSMVADDIGKFPELNLAETLQRLPGVAIVREAGEGRRITVRGLGPDFTRVKLNGMEVLGNVDSGNDSRGQNTRDRGFDFNLFASELFSRVDVAKSYVASQDEGGLAGTVDLYTAKPFDQKGFAFNTAFQGGTNTGTEDFQQRYVGLISQNWDNRFGANLSVAYTRRMTEEQGYNVYRWRRGGGAEFLPATGGGVLLPGQTSAPSRTVPPPDISALSAADQALLRSGDTFFSRGNRYSNWESEQERLGLTGALQWRPTATLEFTMDGLYGRLKGDRQELHIHTRGNVASESSLTNGSDYFLEGGPGSYSVVNLGPARVNAVEINENNEIVYIDVSNTSLGTETRIQDTQNEFRMLALSGAWDPTDRLRVTGLIGAQTSDYDIPVADKFYAEAFGGITVDFRNDWTYGQNHYDFDVADTRNFRAHEFDFLENYQSSDLSTAKIDIGYKVFNGDTISFGVSERSFKNSGSSRSVNDYLAREFRDNLVSDDMSPYAYVYDGHNVQEWVRIDFPAALNHYGIDRAAIMPAFRVQDVWSVEETTHAAYVQYDWDRDFLGRRLRGNAGLRWYSVDLVSSGHVNGIASQFTGVDEDVLPAANVAYELSDNLLVRAAYARNATRPGLASLRFNASASFSAIGELSVSAGNPNLQPFMSDNYDIGLEYVFGSVGAISVAAFQKDITGYVATVTRNNVPLSETGVEPFILNGVQLADDTIVASYSRPENLRDTTLRGLEFNVQSDFFFLPAPFDKFGIVSNLTLVDSELEFARPTEQAAGLSYIRQLEGLSKENANLTLYYDSNDWGARISANYRSDWFNRAGASTGNVPGIGNNLLEEDRNGWLETVYVDANAFYNVNDRVKLTFDAINVTDEREIQYGNFSYRPHNTLESGKTFIFGVSLNY